MKKTLYHFNPDITSPEVLLLEYQNTTFESDNKIGNICSILFDNPRNAQWGINGYMKHEILSCGNTAEILVNRIWSYAHDIAFESHNRNARGHKIRGRWARRKIFRWLNSTDYDQVQPIAIWPPMDENEKRLSFMHEQLGSISHGTIYRCLTPSGTNRQHTIKLISEYNVLIRLTVFQRSVLDTDYIVYDIYVGDIDQGGVIDFFNYLIVILQYTIIMSGHTLYGDIISQYDVKYEDVDNDGNTLYNIRLLS